MKKNLVFVLILSIFFITGCSSEKEKTPEYEENNNVVEQEVIEGDISTQTHAWETYEIIINGSVIQLNKTRLESLLDIGFKVDQKSIGTDEVLANDHMSFMLIPNDKSEGTPYHQVGIANDRDSSQKIENGIVISFSSYGYEGATEATILPKNITIGSNESDVINAYGEANTITVYGDQKTIYYISKDNKVALNIEIKDGKVSFLGIGYILNPYAVS